MSARAGSLGELTAELSEAAIQANILIAITGLPGSMFWRANSGVAVRPDGKPIRFGVPGQPDILGSYRGRAVGIECKAARGRQSKVQRRWQAQWERSGALYIIARSTEDALSALKALQ